MPVASIERSTWAAMAFAPATYAVIFLVPIAAQWSLGGTLKALGMGLMVQTGVGWAAMNEMEVASCVVAAGVGQLATLFWLMNSLLSVPKERIVVD